MAAERFDYNLVLLSKFPCQVRRDQPPLENLVIRIEERIQIRFIDPACPNQFLDHLMLFAKHM